MHQMRIVYHCRLLAHQLCACCLPVREIIVLLKTTLLFFITALAEIIGCFLPWLWLKKGASMWLLLPAALSLGLFVWLLTLHPAASGRVYAAYGGVYVLTAMLWLRVVEGVKLSAWDWSGALIALSGMLIIVAGWGKA
ncbi:YnfA [Pantoea ananatis LMG 20103]|uniref:YnfA n=2 Tax=Pantoea ananas TaxID=553 RepID=D4GF11_PANAM|nr:YnfA [Pantoea ananatis LMG 20103]PKC29701.1 membrane protein [Pantoea ananatis 15320]BAK11378.1 UPF0060 membrane protein YnfA [Pantoea ananatis AJ13355]